MTSTLKKSMLITTSLVLVLVAAFLIAILNHEFSNNKAYNYEHFTSRQYDFGVFDGPEVGDPAIDFVAEDMAGRAVSLSDFAGRIVVLETGSATCPQYVSRIQPMNLLAERFPEVVFLALYVREAHPGAAIPAHRTIEQKRDQAESLISEDGEHRTLLIDDLDGTAHRLYGAWPNMIYVIDQEGTVRFRGKWNEAPVTAVALDRFTQDQSLAGLEPKFSPVELGTLQRVIGRAGSGATGDWLLGIPGTLVGHALEELAAEDGG